ncbi:hypothetical protein SPI_08611 [Niveomyces insectorum RCEF 264]|uniref:Uncharacterized protein n=1 Tax=Niveomyces insectorum RCEF 264 TaxID=1081102 RepID=A0A162MDW0_9HYPO|nr:hypothetical protein SPI_08611 [Niveomyces insectorum RCEF 264]
MTACVKERETDTKFHGWTVDLAEAVLAACAAFTASRRALGFDAWSPSAKVGGAHEDVAWFKTVAQPSAAAALVSCLVLGCAVSSFVHRRQVHDRFQWLVFLLVVGGAAMSGLATKTTAARLWLAYAPWAACSAMVTSYCFHELLRACLGAPSDDRRPALPRDRM